MRPPKDLRSKFELKQEERRLKEIEAENEKKRLEEEKRLAVSVTFLLQFVWVFSAV